MQTLIKSAAVFCVGSFKRVLFSKILFCFTCLKRNNPTAKIPTNVVRMFVIPKETLISGEIKPYKNKTLKITRTPVQNLIQVLFIM